jgi:TonB family protein
MLRTLAVFTLALAALAETPKLTRQVKPVFPQAAKDAQITGLVRLEIDISAAGRVTDIRPLIGHPLLVEAASEAVRQWEYETADPLRAQVDLNFDLAGFPRTGGTAMHVRGTTQMLKLVEQVKPAYPVEAKQQALSGTVRLQALISKTGDVAAVRVLEGAPMLVGAAVDAIKLWKYEPTDLEGSPVEVVTDIDVNFVLPAVQQG